MRKRTFDARVSDIQGGMMDHMTFGEVRRIANAAGLVMSRREDGIHLRYRNGNISGETWSCARAHDALEVVRKLTKMA